MTTTTRIRKSPAVRREEILTEALRLIGRRGFHAFTIRELSAACDLSQAGMLHYFSSKDVLLAAVIDQLEASRETALADHAAACEERVGRGESALAEFRQLLGAMMEHIVEDPDMARFVAVIQVEAVDPQHPAHNLFLGLERLALAFYQRMLASTVEDPEAIASGLHAAMFGLVQQWVRQPGSFDLVDRWMTIVSALLPEPDRA